MNDKQLLLLLHNAPGDGIAKAIELYGGTVKWIAVKLLGNGHSQDIEECVSDTFWRFYQSIDRYQPESGVSMKSYLCGIARHTALDYRRKLQKQASMVPIEENELGVQVDMADELAKVVNEKILQQAVDALPPPDKEIFIRRYYMGERVAAIAQALSLDTKTVENKLYRGKQKLKTNLVERGVIL